MWQQGHKCPYCNGSKIHINNIKKEFEGEGYILLSNEYINAKTKLDYICSNGHRHSISFTNWKSGKRCPYCAGNIKNNLEVIKELFKKEGYVILSNDYKNAHTKLDIECPKGHKFKSSWHNWQQGKRCPICPSQQSKFEKEIRKFIDNNNINYITNDRNIIINPETNRSMELDLYFPGLNKAIECNGVYWHSKKLVLKRDKIKLKLCKDAGINLLVITDNFWYKNNYKAKIKINKFLNYN